MVFPSGFPSGFPYFLQFKSEFGNKGFTISVSVPDKLEVRIKNTAGPLPQVEGTPACPCMFLLE